MDHICCIHILVHVLLSLFIVCCRPCESVRQIPCSDTQYEDEYFATSSALVYNYTWDMHEWQKESNPFVCCVIITLFTICGCFNISLLPIFPEALFLMQSWLSDVDPCISAGRITYPWEKQNIKPVTISNALLKEVCLIFSKLLHTSINDQQQWIPMNPQRPIYWNPS